VNKKRWEEIQLHFPTQVQNRLEGFEEEDEEMQGQYGRAADKYR